MSAKSAVISGYLFFLLAVFSPVQAEIVKIGILAALTGVRADGGAYLRAGVSIAQNEIGEDPARKYKLQFIFEDSQYLPQTAVSAFWKLKNVDHVNFIIGGQGSSDTLAVAPLAERTRTIFITPAAGSDEISDAGDYIFRTMHNTAQEAPVSSKLVAGQMKGDTIHFLALSTAITPSYLKHFKPAIEKRGKKVGLVEEFDALATDMRAQITKIKSEGATDVFLLATPTQLGLIMKQSQGLGFKPQFYTMGVQGPETIKVGGDAAEGLLYCYSYDDESREPQVRRFLEKYSALYQDAPDGIAANAYDAAYLLSDCFEKTGPEANAVKTCLYQVHEVHGASGTFSFDNNGDAVRRFIVKTIRDQKFVKYSDIDGTS